MLRSRITAIEDYTPGRIVSSTAIEDRLNKDQLLLPPGSIERIFGVKERRFAATEEQVSDIAVAAAQKILDRIDPSTIDYLIFAAASADLIEPATANIIQAKLRLRCPVFDLKNACNSFVTALQVANAFIVTGQYKKILVVTGEKLSDAIKYDVENKEELMQRAAAYSLGDAGAAALIEPSNDDSGFYKQHFESFGEYWTLCTIPGGGSLFPHDVSKNYFEGKTTELRHVFLDKKGRIAENCLAEMGWCLDDVSLFFMHHVSRSTFGVVAESLGINTDRFYNVIEGHGNIAAASIPLAMSRAAKCGRLNKGDKAMIIGLASGISISIQLLIW